MDLVAEITKLLEENVRLKRALTAIREAQSALGLTVGPAKKARGRKPRARKAKSRVSQGPARRGRKNKFTDDDARTMAKQKEAGGTFKSLSAEWKASIPTIMRTIERVNGAHA
jgi:hypothetical protein